MTPPNPRLPNIDRLAARRTQETLRFLGTEIRRQREDAGISQRRLAAAAGISQPHLARIETGDAHVGIATLERICLALDADLRLAVYPNSGPRLRDRFQPRMIEELLNDAGPWWRWYPEVLVSRPVRGVIDVVGHDPRRHLVVSVEAQSQIHRLEQQLRWSGQKADALPSATIWPEVATEDVRVARILLLRSTRNTRDLAAAFDGTLRAAYPAPMAEVRAALRDPDLPWPGNGLLWMTVDGREARFLGRLPPRPAPGIRVPLALR